MSKTLNILVTGIPRAGTTLLGALLDSLPNTVCLSEPPWHWHKSTGGQLDIGPDPTGEVFAKWLIGDFFHLRRKLVLGQAVPDRRSKGNLPFTNYHAARPTPEEKTHSTLHLTNYCLDSLDPQFTLAIKHNGPYLTALGPLVDLDYFSIIGMVRNPIDVIHSWRSLNLPVSRGMMHDAARCWPEMGDATKRGDILERQVKIYDLICKRLHSYRDRISVLCYEDVIKDPSCVTKVIDSPFQPDSLIIGKPSRSVSEKEHDLIAEALVKHGNDYQLFYATP